MRSKKIIRNTLETNIDMEINLDGLGKSDIDTPIGFFNHMMTLVAFHSKIDISLKATGDIDVCDHHLIEDIGIVFGQLLNDILGDRRGIKRYGSFRMPMDESLAVADIDISGRSFLVFNCDFKRESIGSLSTEMIEEFFRAFAFNANITLHLNLLYGKNDHHKAEAIFKAFGRTLSQSVKIISNEIPSSKGVI